jgi:hypothetical protein
LVTAESTTLFAKFDRHAKPMPMLPPDGEQESAS